MNKFIYGNPKSDIVLVQMVDEYDLKNLDNEVSLFKKSTNIDFCLIAIKVDDWNKDLSPWKAPAVFGKEAFLGGASETLKVVLDICSDKSKKYFIGGYSLAALFALWTTYQTDIFSGAACASPSMWFPGLIEYMSQNDIKTSNVYLSLGDLEEKTKNPVMATVGIKINEAYALLKEKGVNTILEMNPGNHFKDADVRTAKAFAWLLKQ